MKQKLLGGYKNIKKLAKELGCNVTDLLALSRNRDPFYSGGKSSREKAEWFADIWKSECFEEGIHLRRIHYRLVSKNGSTRANGTPYENDQKSWAYLLEAACHARYLGLVDAEKIVDRRNPDPFIQACAANFPTPTYARDEISWEVPYVSAKLQWSEDWELPSVFPVGYKYSKNLQPYHLEIWTEKTTINDVFEPLCREFGANLIAGAGFLSITSVIELLCRVASTKKPCRIFYVSDFDPAGSFMPFAVARQIEFWTGFYSLECDIKLKHVALTQEQVEKYQLPSIPIKSTDTRKDTFRKKYGQDATEVDALEANRPGELGQIVRKELEKYYDEMLSNSYKEAREEAANIANKWKEEYLGKYEDGLRGLNEQKQIIIKKYEKELKEIQEKCGYDFNLIREQIGVLQHAVQNEMDSAFLDIPSLPKPNVVGDEEEDLWIFDSSRDYLQQLEIYKAHMPNKLNLD